MDNNKSKDGYRPMIQISLNKDGHKKVDFAPVAKDVIVSLLRGALTRVEAMPDNVTNVPAGLSAGGVRNFINRHKKKKGGFGS